MSSTLLVYWPKKKKRKILFVFDRCGMFMTDLSLWYLVCARGLNLFGLPLEFLLRTGFLYLVWITCSSRSLLLSYFYYVVIVVTISAEGEATEAEARSR